MLYFQKESVCMHLVTLCCAIFIFAIGRCSPHSCVATWHICRILKSIWEVSLLLCGFLPGFFQFAPSYFNTPPLHLVSWVSLPLSYVVSETSFHPVGKQKPWLIWGIHIKDSHCACADGSLSELLFEEQIRWRHTHPPSGVYRDVRKRLEAAGNNLFAFKPLKWYCDSISGSAC